MENTSISTWARETNCPETCQIPAQVISDYHLSPWPYVGYTIEGTVFSIANLLIFCTILRHPALRWRKEYLIVAALAFADVNHEVAFVVGGIERIKLTNSEDKIDAIRCKYSYECIMTAHAFLWNISFPLVYFMLLCISIDRFVFVLKPLVYKTMSIKWSFAMSGLFYLCALIVAAIRILVSYLATQKQLENHQCPEIEGLCLLDHAFGDASFYISTIIQLFCSLASVLLYAVIPFIYKKQVRRLAELGEFGQTELYFLQACWSS